MSPQDPYPQRPATSWNPATPDPSGATAHPSTQPGQPAYGQPAYAQPAPSYVGASTGAPTYGTPPPFGAPPYPAPDYGVPTYAEHGFPGFGVFTYASWGQRVGAYLLDSLVLLPYLVALVFMTATSEPGVDRYGYPADQPTAAGEAAVLVSALVGIVLWGWNRWVRAGRTGQSWGKQVVGLTMQRDVTGEPIGVGMAFLRDFAHSVDGIFYLGYLWPLWDGKRQTFSDKIVKSVVVR